MGSPGNIAEFWDIAEWSCGSGLFRKLGRISSGCWQIVYGLCTAAWLPGLILVSSVICSVFLVRSWILAPVLHPAGKLETLSAFSAVVNTFQLITCMQVKWFFRKVWPNRCQLLLQLSSVSEKESRVALRLSSTSGCQAAGMLSARGCLEEMGNSDWAKGTGITGKDGKPGAGARVVWFQQKGRELRR